MAGASQFIKQFQASSVPEFGSAETVGWGTNVAVFPVHLNSLTTRGWQPVIDLRTGQTRTRGNFAIVNRDKLTLDYSMAENPRWDPSRWLVDELVQVEEGLLLGRAYLQVGPARLPISYFALSRVDELSTAEGW